MTAAELAALRGSALERVPVIAEILSAVAGAFGLTPSAVLARDRSKSVKEARLLVYYLARRCTRASYPEIGRALERDHTTVMSGELTAISLIARDPWLRELAAGLSEHFGEREERFDQ